MNQINKYIIDRDEQVRWNLTDKVLEADTEDFTESLVRTNYIKNFTWMGVPILQYPQDLMIMQELIFEIRPAFIIETGIAFGGMTRFYADMLRLLDRTATLKERRTYSLVISVDVDIRPHARDVLGSSYIKTIEGSSTDEQTLEEIKETIGEDPEGKVLVSLDSNHTHDHVLKELELYSPLVSVGSYLVVYDTAIEFYGHLDKNQERPWSKGNNPYSAIQEFLKGNDNFVVDREIEKRAVITSAIGGYLKRIK